MCLTLLSVLAGHAQGTLQFSAHLTGPTTSQTGEGAFTLTGNVFTFYVRSVFGFSIGEIRGPAAPGSDAPVIFNLGPARCVAPGPDGSLGFCDFGFFTNQSYFVLDEARISELLGEMWYVYAYVPDLPLTGLRGQIVLVPEPNSLILVVLAAAASFVRLASARRNSRRRLRSVTDGLEPREKP